VFVCERERERKKRERERERVRKMGWNRKFKNEIYFLRRKKNQKRLFEFREFQLKRFCRGMTCNFRGSKINFIGGRINLDIGKCTFIVLQIKNRLNKVQQTGTPCTLISFSMTYVSYVQLVTNAWSTSYVTCNNA